jgi:hypothetical protein
MEMAQVAAFGGRRSAGRFGAILGILLMTAAALPALGAAGDASIAKAVAVRPEATGVFNGATTVILAEDELYQGQKIATGARGEVQIVFADDTHLVIGAGSSLVIDKYLMRNGGTASSFAINALGGTFRFITGNSPKSAYKITTPTGTLAVRGTKFDFSVSKKKGKIKTTVVVFEGEVKLCPNTGSCESVGRKCQIGVAEGSSATLINSGESARASAASDLPYVSSQGSLRNDFKIKSAGSCGGDTTEVTNSSKPAVAAPAPTPDPKPKPDPHPIPDPKPAG